MSRSRGSGAPQAPGAPVDPSADDISHYEIRVHGRLDAGWGAVLGLVLERQTEHTVLIGHLDQAALHRVLRQIAELGMRLDAIVRAAPGSHGPCD